MLGGNMFKNVVKTLAALACLPMLVWAAETQLRLGAHVSLNQVGEITDATWGVYADGVGYGATLSLDVSYRFSPWLSLHSGVGLDYRYFSSEFQHGSLESLNTTCLIGSPCEYDDGYSWSGYDKDYLLYLEIPLLAQFQIPNVIYFEVGPVFDFKLMRKSDHPEPEGAREDKCQEDRFAGAGISVGIGHEFSFGLFIDLRLSYQLTDVVSVDKNCGSYTVTVWKSYLDPETGEAISEKDFDYASDIESGTYFLFNKIQLGIGYWF